MRYFPPLNLARGWHQREFYSPPSPHHPPPPHLLSRCCCVLAAPEKAANQFSVAGSFPSVNKSVSCLSLLRLGHGRRLIIKPAGLIRLHEKGQRSKAVGTSKNELSLSWWTFLWMMILEKPVASSVFGYKLCGLGWKALAKRLWMGQTFHSRLTKWSSPL